ncbi:MAG: hypothetical protein IJS70_07810 [Bacteroidales bacterium]|nr:hypothetical protein [Bacteroidales bacterium]MBQ6081405.1 hypothetical protein [Bacteroidales bacterium]MBQ7459056.1 hypothetical protein [Bacteroidales bacterium]
MYRTEADLIMGFNCLALAILETDSRLLGEGFMPTHNHKFVLTDCFEELTRRERYAYTRYFNTKHFRQGRLAERQCFSLEVEGIVHTQTALSYVLRQGLHHGLSQTPFGYRHCSANVFFRKDLGKEYRPELLPDKSRYLYLPHGKSLPLNYRMSSNGLILREDIIDTGQVEQIYVTPRNFLYQMNRLSDEKMSREQIEENGLPPVTLDAIEKGVAEFDVQAALRRENGRAEASRLTDLEMCRIIDDIYLPHFSGSGEISIYTLSQGQRAALADTILQDWQKVRNGGRPYICQAAALFKGRRASVSQIRRCLALM